MDYLDTNRVMITYHIPLNEIIFDYFDRLKSATRGYASLDYELADYKESKLVKVDILLNGDPVDALSTIVHKDRAASRGRQLAAKLKEIIPQQMFEIPIQAAVGGKIIARETVRAMRTCAPAARMCSRSATAAISRASASCSRSRRKARSA